MVAEYLLHHLLVNSACRYPERQAVVFMDRILTYADLHSQSDRLAAFLSDCGVAVGDRVGIMQPKSMESVIALFAILKTGAAYVPIDPSVPAQRARHIIHHCGLRCLITTGQQAKRIMTGIEDLPLQKIILAKPQKEIEEIGAPVDVIHWDDIMNRSPHDYCSPNMSDTNPAYILHTSGSTGMPKGVVLSHLNALSFIDMASGYFEISEADRFANHAPLHFDLSVFDIFVAIKRGASIVIVPDYLSAFPVRLVEYIREKKVSIWNSVSSVLILLADKGKIDKHGLDRMRIVHFSGDILPVKYLRILQESMPEATFYNIYGQTEANSSMCFRVDKTQIDDTKPIPIGKPFPNFEVFAMDGHRVVSEPDEEGELYVKSSTVAIGYWGEDGMTSEKFPADPRRSQIQSRVYRTGDIVKRGGDGNYSFVGRKDHMIKSKGYRIEIPEIENVIQNHESVKQVAVVAIPDEAIGNRIIGYICPVAGGELEMNDLSAFCGNVLPKYMIPEEFILCDALPTTSTGKVDRNTLREMYMRKATHKP